MAKKDWEKLAGESGEEVVSSRWGRALALGKAGAKVGASLVARRAQSIFSGAEGAEARMSEAMTTNAQHVAEVLGRLKGASMKVGQMLSADPELVPDEFRDALAGLQSEAPPMTYRTVKEQIEAELERPIELAFETFQPEPIGSASIGQVHRATLPGGEPVAVKVQYPGVEAALESDLKSLSTVLGYGRAMVEKKRLEAYVGEIREAILEEADYTKEAAHLARFGALLGAREGVRVPKVYAERSSRRVLVMEYMEGTKIDEALERSDPEERRRVLRAWVELYTWMFHELHELHADPHPGNFLLQEDGTMVVLDFGNVKRFEERFTDGILELLVTFWRGDAERAAELYDALRFGGDKFTAASIDPALIEAYHDVVLRPFARDEAFDFGAWRPAHESRRFMLEHPSFLRLTPPAEAIPYFRMLSGVKGLLARFEAKLNVYEIAYEHARRRGFLDKAPSARPS